MSSNPGLQKINSQIDNQVENIDIEAQNDKKEVSKPELEIRLKGILKDPNQNAIDEKLVERRLLQICVSLLVIIIMTPIIVSDLYFGFSDTSCSREQPDGLEMNLRLYLLVSGFTGLSAMILIITGAWTLLSDDMVGEKVCTLCCGSIMIMGIVLFNLIWNILGAVTFWKYVYGNGTCDKSFSTYMFVSLIIKLCSSLLASQSNKKNDSGK